MKHARTLFKIVLTASLLGATALAFTGCGYLDKMYQQKVTYIGPTTNAVTRIETNTVQIAAASTNAATGEITAPRFEQQVTPIVTYTVKPAHYETNLVETPFIAGAAQAAGALPIPFAGTAAALLGLLYSSYAAIRNRQVSKALVMGIETGRQILQTTPEGKALDSKFKDALIQHQEIAGVLKEASALVSDYTGNTVP